MDHYSLDFAEWEVWMLLFILAASSCHNNIHAAHTDVSSTFPADCISTSKTGGKNNKNLKQNDKSIYFCVYLIVHNSSQVMTENKGEKRYSILSECCGFDESHNLF